MVLARTADIIEKARSQNSAVPAFNVVTLEHIEGIVSGAERAKSSVILQVSENAVLYRFGAMRPIVAACRELAVAAKVPVAIHLDHIQDARLAGTVIVQAQELGISSIMIDAAHLSYGQNVEQTAALTKQAQSAGLWVEAELGAIGGKDGAHAPGVRTDPFEASGFVDATGVDGLAVAVGSSHSMVSREAALDIDLIERITTQLEVPLVLHGSSGVPDSALRDAVIAGIRKVNIGTALNVAFTETIQSYLEENQRSMDPRKYLSLARAAIADEVDRLCAILAY